LNYSIYLIHKDESKRVAFREAELSKMNECVPFINPKTLF